MTSLKFHVDYAGVLVYKCDTREEARAFVKEAVKCNPRTKPFDYDIEAVLVSEEAK